jgi:dTDP-4-amino-4,6-dideoxygalactose transaminase
MTIPFIDLAAQQARIRPQIDAALARVLDHGQYILGPEVMQLEGMLAEFSEAKHCLSCANGTDALQLALMALGIGEGDAVFVPSFTFAATAEVVPLVNATPVFVDVLPDTFNMDPDSLKRAIVHAKELGLRPAAVIPVDLFGLAADYDQLTPIAREAGMAVIDDAAQGYGALYHNRRTGSIADITTTSFFPAKPLGCYGDGGAVFTESDELAALIDSFRIHGKGSHKYFNDRVGINSRLDTIQAVILIEKMALYREEIDLRQTVARRYSAALKGQFEVPYIPQGLTSVWAQYTVVTSGKAERAALQEACSKAGVPTVIYYPMPLHAQKAYAHFPRDPNGLTVSEALCDKVLSLPMHPYLEADVQDRIIDTLLSARSGLQAA